MRSQENYGIDLKNKLLIGKIAEKLKLTREQLLKYFSDCEHEFFLFTQVGDFLFSESFVKRMEALAKIKGVRSEAGKRGMKSRYNKDEESNNKTAETSNKTDDIQQQSLEKSNDRLIDRLTDRQTENGVLLTLKKKGDAASSKNHTSPEEAEEIRKARASLRNSLKSKPIAELLPEVLEAIPDG